MNNKGIYCIMLFLSFYLIAGKIQSQTNFEIVPQVGNVKQLSSCSYLPDGKYFLTTDWEKSSKLWDVTSSKEIRVFEGGVKVFSQDGKYIFSAGENLILYEIATGKEIISINNTSGDIRVTALSHDCKYALTGGGNNKLGVLNLWDLTSGKILRSFDGHLGTISSVNFSPEGKRILSSSYKDFGAPPENDMTLLWDLDGNKILRIVGKLSAFSPDGKFIMSTQSGGSLALWDIEQNKLAKTFNHPTARYAECLTIDPQNKYVAAIVNNEKIIIWDIKTTKVVQEIIVDELYGELGFDISFSPDGNDLLFVGKKLWKIFNVKSGLVYKSSHNNVLTASSLLVLDNNILFGVSRSINSWDIGNITLKSVLTLNPTFPYMPSDKLENANKSYRIWNILPYNHSKGIIIHAGHELYSYNLATNERHLFYTGIVYQAFVNLSILPNDSALLFSEWDSDIKLINFQNGQTLNSFKANGKAPALNCTPDGKTLLYGRSTFGAVDIKTNSELFLTPWKYRRTEISSIAVSRDGHYILTGGSDTISLRENGTFKVIKKFDGPGSSISFSPDGKRAVSSRYPSSIDLWDVSNGKIIKSFNTGSFPEVKFAPDGKNVISMSTQGEIEFWDVETGNSVRFFISENQKEWLIISNDGYWDASPNGGKLIAMVNGMDCWNIDQFAVKNNRPDILLQRVGSTNKDLIAHYNNQYKKRLKKLGLTENQLTNDYSVPIARINENKQSGKISDIKFSFTDEKYQLKRYNVYVNDIPIYGSYGKPINGNTIDLAEKIELTKGENKIEVSCMNEKGAESYRALSYANYKGESKGDLYLLAFGVSKYQNPAYNLQFADKDAKDLSTVVEGLKGKGYDKVYTKILTNEQVTPEAIKAAKDFGKNAKPDDTFILFIAGHGMHDSDPEATYYYLTSNAEVNNLKATAADFETIEDLLQGIPPRNKLFLMDACESGEIDEEDQGQLLAVATGTGIASRGFKATAAPVTSNQQPVTKRNYLYQKDRYIYNDLVRRSGAIVFSSSKGGELSYERSDIENGLFTEYLMKALTTTEADKDGNGIVSTDELRQYVSEQAAKASGGLQHPTVDRDNIYQKFGFQIK
ncbi:MAG: caspase family protein [Salinivirgaceae bacterium]